MPVKLEHMENDTGHNQSDVRSELRIQSTNEASQTPSLLQLHEEQDGLRFMSSSVMNNTVDRSPYIGKLQA